MTNGFTIDLTLGEHHKMQLLLITNKPTFSISFSLRDVIKNVCNWFYNKEENHTRLKLLVAISIKVS